MRVCLNARSSLLHPSGVFREATTEFTVDARSLTQRGGDHIKAEVKNPSGALTDCSLTDNADGTYGVEYTPFENGNTSLARGGPKDLLSRLTDPAVFLFWFFSLSSGTHSIQVLYDDTPVPKSPFRVSVMDGCNPRRVVASGPGLEQALTNKPNNFNIVTRYCCLNKERDSSGQTGAVALIKQTTAASHTQKVHDAPLNRPLLLFTMIFIRVTFV